MLQTTRISLLDVVRVAARVVCGSINNNTYLLQLEHLASLGWLPQSISKIALFCKLTDDKSFLSAFAGVAEEAAAATTAAPASPTSGAPVNGWGRFPPWPARVGA